MKVCTAHRAFSGDHVPPPSTWSNAQERHAAVPAVPRQTDETAQGHERAQERVSPQNGRSEMGHRKTWEGGGAEGSRRAYLGASTSQFSDMKPFLASELAVLPVILTVLLSDPPLAYTCLLQRRATTMHVGCARSKIDL